MLETTLILTLVTIFYFVGLRTKPQPLANALNISREGEYHALLAPQLNLAAPFIQAVVQQYRLTPPECSDTDTLCFQVRDAHLSIAPHEFYLLAVTQRQGELYFQAIAPAPLVRDSDSHYVVAREFAVSALAALPAPQTLDHAAEERIIAALQTIAEPRGIRLSRLLP